MVTRTARRRGSRNARYAGRRAANSEAMRFLARAGLAARGIMYVITAWIAVQIAFGHSRQQADRTGALHSISSTPVGGVLLWLLVIGFFGMALWRLSEAVYGAPGTSGSKASRRLAALARAIIARGIVFVTAGIFLVVAAVDARPQQAKGIDSSLRALAATPLGPWLLVLVAVGLIMFGLFSCCGAKWIRL